MSDLADILAHLDDTLRTVRTASKEIKSIRNRAAIALRAIPGRGGDSSNAPINLTIGQYALDEAIKKLETAATDVALEIACATLPDDADATGLYEETIARVVRERRAA